MIHAPSSSLSFIKFLTQALIKSSPIKELGYEAILAQAHPKQALLDTSNIHCKKHFVCLNFVVERAYENCLPTKISRFTVYYRHFCAAASFMNIIKGHPLMRFMA
jgi:hypothetical protein